MYPKQSLVEQAIIQARKVYVNFVLSHGRSIVASPTLVFSDNPSKDVLICVTCLPTNSSSQL
jgi:hypothetical protein